MRSVRTPSRAPLGIEERLQDLYEVLNDIAAAINTEEDIYALSVMAPAEAWAPPVHDHIIREELGAAQAGASWQFSEIHIPGTERVFLNNFPLRVVTSSPGINEYTINNATYTITLWTSKGASEFLEVDFLITTAVDHDHIIHEELGAAQAGASWQFSQAHVSGTERVFMNLLPLRRVASSPGLNEYTIDVPTYTITLWASKGTGDFLEVDFAISTGASHSHFMHETLGAGLSGAVWNLASTPTSGTERLFLNNFPLRRVASGPSWNEYTITGAQITLWTAKGAADHLEADYLT